MNLANLLTRMRMCVAVLGVGCVNETSDPEAAPLAQDVQFGEDDHDGETKLPHLPDLPWALPKGEGPKVVGVETHDVTVPSGLHAQGLAVPAKLVVPKWSQPVGERPAVMVLHGSGGLLKMPEGAGDDPCSEEMEPQFELWSERLAKLGYVVLLPSSYSVRGFCDKHDDAANIPATFDDGAEQVLGRLYDVDATARYLCDRPEVDCEHMGLLGFSQGATAVMMAQHWQIDHAIAQFRATKGDTIDIEIPDVPPGRPEFQVGIAYYPGCGLDGVVPFSLSSKAIEDNFFTNAPLTLLHAEKDPLIEHCSVAHGPGTREVQADKVADQLATTNTYELTVYSNAGHSFDNPGGWKSGGGTEEGDAAAREAALAVTLAQLAMHLDP